MKLIVEHAAVRLTIEPNGSMEEFFITLEQLLSQLYETGEKSEIINDACSIIAKACNCSERYVRMVMRDPNKHHSVLAHEIKAIAMNVSAPDGYWFNNISKPRPEVHIH